MFVVNDPKKGMQMRDKTKTLGDYIEDTDAEDGVVVIHLKDMGFRVGYLTVFIVEYIGPILIAALFCLLRWTCWAKEIPLTLFQSLAVGMIFFHYIKREFESCFVHRFSNDTMPIQNIFINSIYYWVLMALICYYLLRPEFVQPSWVSMPVFYVFMGLWLCCQISNGVCHLTLRNLRRPGTTERNIPKGCCFGFVSCANYFWESMGWLLFAISTQLWPAYVFWALGTAIMCSWALKKHKRY
jgi:very-long-chain enoyl-CoA reductase